MESYEFELWAQLPEDESLNVEADEVGDFLDIDLSEEQVEALIQIAKSSGFETSSEESLEEKMPELHRQLRAAAEALAKKSMALRKYVGNKYSVDEEDLFEEDTRSRVFFYQKPVDIDGGMDDEEEYADALYSWQQWESARILDMEPSECVSYLSKRYEIEPDMEDVDFGYRIPDEIVAEAMARFF